MIVPIDSRYASYQSMRGAVALGQGAVLPAGSSGFGLHPSMTNVQRLYGQNRAAAVKRARLDSLTTLHNALVRFRSRA